MLRDFLKKDALGPLIKNSAELEMLMEYDTFNLIDGAEFPGAENKFCILNSQGVLVDLVQ